MLEPRVGMKHELTVPRGNSLNMYAHAVEKSKNLLTIL